MHQLTCDERSRHQMRLRTLPEGSSRRKPAGIPSYDMWQAHGRPSGGWPGCCQRALAEFTPAARQHGEAADAHRPLVLGSTATTCGTTHMSKRISMRSFRTTEVLWGCSHPVASVVPKPAVRGQSGHVTVRSEDRSTDRHTHRRPPGRPARCASRSQTQCAQSLVFCAGPGC